MQTAIVENYRVVNSQIHQFAVANQQLMFSRVGRPAFQ